MIYFIDPIEWIRKGTFPLGRKQLANAKIVWVWIFVMVVADGQ
jgi:hypothetical protein